MIWDLVIIGGGPVGSYAGYLSAKNNIKTLILEEHDKIGEPIHCLGKLSVHAFEEFDLPKESIVNNLKGGYFFSPSGEYLKLKKDYFDSFILDRILFDKIIAENAEKNGCSYSFNSKAVGVNHYESHSTLIVEEKGKTKYINAKVILVAEGAKRQFLRKIGLKTRPYLISLQYEVSGLNPLDKECVEVYLGSNYSPGFFLWISPFKNIVKLGVAVNPSYNPKEFLENFIKNELRERSEKIYIEKAYGGIIPIFGPYEEFISPNILIVGDAAGYNKSTTGGGIYFGLKGAEIAVNQIKKYLEDNNIFHLSNYPKITKKSFGKELIFTKVVRKFLNSLRDNDLNLIWDILKENDKILKDLEKYGDTAYQTSIIKIFPNLITPKVFVKLLPLIKNFINSLL